MNGGTSSRRRGRFTGSDTDMWSEPIARFVRYHASGSRLLDVGCHVGNLVAAAGRLGFDAEGIDIDPLATAEAERLGRPVRNARIEELAGPYDVVVLIAVLEHILDLLPFLTAAERVLDPGGRLFVFVPYYRGLVPRLMRDRWIGWAPSQHVWHFTPRTLDAVLTGATGLRTVSWTTTGAIEPPSSGAKGRVKALVTAAAQKTGRGDQIEAIYERPALRRRIGESDCSPAYRGPIL
jgi:2-polyprenyl-3-methyl-5-hydroxy-6-metoxy-1,4-benzoquinol methylase